MTKDEILEYALRYVDSNDSVDFAGEGDLLAMFAREVPTDRILKENEGWSFVQYMQCLHYTLDTDSKPAGKWIWCDYLCFNTYPPQKMTLKLQPPHIVLGKFQDPARTNEFKMEKLVIRKEENTLGLFGEEKPEDKANTESSEKNNADESNPADNILSFPKK